MTATEIIFVCAFLWVAWTYIGYPIALFVRAKLLPRPHKRMGEFKSPVSIVIASHNEEAAIVRRIVELSGLVKASGVTGEIIIVSDGSTDQTIERAQNSAVDGVPVRIIELKQNVGKASAISAGCAAAENQIIILADTRQTWAPDALTRLLENFADPTVGGASGELILESSPGIQAGVGLYWKYEKWIRRTEAIVASTVGVSGSICAVRRELFPSIPQGMLLDDVYWPMQVVRKGYRIVHDQRARAFDRLPPKSSDEFRRKVRTLAGNFQLIARQPRLLLPWSNPIWAQFISHKVMRLGVPWAMLLMLGCCMVDRSIVANVLLGMQIMFYFVGLIATIGGTRARFFLASPIASFLLLNAAAWTAFWVWISGRATRSWHKTLYQTGIAG